MVNFLASESARVLRGLASVIAPVREAAGEPAAEFRIDDLAREAGTSVRNVRVYQDRGLLPPPRREGRTGWYSESHLARLNLINRMLERGYTFATITELLTAAQYGLRVEEVLDVDRVRSSDLGPTTTTTDELRGLFGDAEFEVNLARAEEAGLVRFDDGAFRVAHPRLIEATKLLTDAGIPVTRVLDSAVVVRADLRDVAERFVRLVTDQYLPADGEPFAPDAEALASLTELINTGRTLIHDVVHSMLVDVMEETIRAVVDDAAERMGATAADRVGAINVAP